MTSFDQNITKISQGAELSEQEIYESIKFIIQGDASEEQITSFLTELSARDIGVNEITGAARILRDMSSTIKAPGNALDCCGTGGDGVGTYNISTAVALVCAACNVPIAKHGNRAASSKSGAADVLESLGVNLETSHDILERALEEINFCFLMAPQHHQAMKHVAPIRKKLGFRTIFNLLGPLANPASAPYQLIGIYDPKLLRPMAKTLHKLGTKRAWIVHGLDGLDEITTTADTKIAILSEDGSIEEKTLSPSDFGLPSASIDDIKGGDANENAEALMALLNGAPSAYRDIVLANSAAVLNIHGKASSLIDGVEIARHVIVNGQAKQVLATYIEMTNE